MATVRVGKSTGKFNVITASGMEMDMEIKHMFAIGGIVDMP